VIDDASRSSEDADTPAVLTVGGSDPSGGAGVQADLKTFAALDAYGASVLTLATDCTTAGVDDLHLLPPDFVVRQLERVASDLQPDAAKTGMLFDADLIEAVLATVDRLDLAPLVVDPVITTRRGETLLSPDAVAAMKRLIEHATVVTPSRPEAAELAQMDVRTRRDVERAARAIRKDLGPAHVVITGGHADGDAAADCWFDGAEARWLEAERQPYAVHGAGDTLSAALAVGLAEGHSVEPALRRAKAVVTEALRHAPDRGHGHRPLAHGAGVEAISPANE
jgi:hydroxymethylpyrimidine/phosphomethylpyrimidine kinase